MGPSLVEYSICFYYINTKTGCQGCKKKLPQVKVRDKIGGTPDCFL